jgi:hypothetical protein
LLHPGPCYLCKSHGSGINSWGSSPVASYRRWRPISLPSILWCPVGFTDWILLQLWWSFYFQNKNQPSFKTLLPASSTLKLRGALLREIAVVLGLCKHDLASSINIALNLRFTPASIFLLMLDKISSRNVRCYRANCKGNWVNIAISNTCTWSHISDVYAFVGMCRSANFQPHLQWAEF